MAVYLLDVPGKRRGGVHSATEIRVTYRQLRRATGRRIGGLFTEVENAGIDKSQIDVYASEALDARGQRGPVRGWRLRMLDVSDSIRTLREEDEARIAERDAEVERCKEALREARDARARTMREAFKVGRKLYAQDMVELIDG